jgi:hypothetical protein
MAELPGREDRSPGRALRRPGEASAPAAAPVARVEVAPAPGLVPAPRRTRRMVEAIVEALLAAALVLLTVILALLVPPPAPPEPAPPTELAAEALPELVPMELAIVRRARAVAPQPGPVTLRIAIPPEQYPYLASFAVRCADTDRWGPPVPSQGDLPAGAREIRLARVHPTGCRVQFRNGAANIDVRAFQDLSCSWRSQLVCR